MPNPTDVHTLKSFIGLCNYYRIYVHDFSTIIQPFYAFLKRDVTWTWSEEAQEAFNTLKEKLSEFPILKRPDFSKVFILHIDRSAFGIGAILGQLDKESKEYVIAYASRSNNKVESDYSSYERECLAFVWAVIHFRPYLYGTNDKLTGKLARWALIFQDYEFKVSITHQNVDTMSWRPLTTFEHFSEARQTSTKFQQYIYLMHLVILHYCNLTWLSIPLLMYGRTWTL
jgi:hypothetical protein